jgi:hypothetical protein
MLMRMSSPGSHADSELPAVDERLVAPESGYEIDDGKLVRVPPSDELHGSRHSRVAALLEAHVADDFNVAVDMLTRTSKIDDIAPDASVYPAARNPQTGGRQLEHLAFEVVSTQTLANAGRKAGKLVGRGVRRVFAINVGHARAFEWSADLGTWSLLDPDSSIVDRALAVPLPVPALVEAMNADDAIARALLAKHNPVLVAELSRTRAEGRAAGQAEGQAEGQMEGQAAGRAAAILLVLAQRDLHPSRDERERILAERDLDQLDRWLTRALTCGNVAELFA